LPTYHSASVPAKQHNSLLILTFDESDKSTLRGGLTSPADKDSSKRNRIATILAGARIKPGEYAEGKGVDYVSLLPMIEAMYKLDKSGAQPSKALKAGIADDFLMRDIFEATPLARGSSDSFQSLLHRLYCTLTQDHEAFTFIAHSGKWRDISCYPASSNSSYAAT
jgi:hypothetical protein